METNLEILEKEIGYTFKNKSLLRTALTHTSYAYENKVKSYERLEYLGDSILEFISSKYLFENYERLSEGEMTKVRAYSVCEDTLFQIASKHNFSDFLYLGKSERTSKDINIVQKFILDNIKDFVEFGSNNVGIKDYKTVLQEMLQVHGEVLIQYSIIKEEGPDHNKSFTAEVKCDGKSLAIGSGRSKKAAETEAARKAIDLLKNGGISSEK